jgi:hypothetical protein
MEWLRFMDFGLQKNYEAIICLLVMEYYLIMNPHVVGNFVTRKITMATAAIAKGSKMFVLRKP